MRWLSFALLAMSALAQSSDWMDLFPDSRFSRWTRIPIPPTAPLGAVQQWKVNPEERIVLCEGNGGHEMLRFDRELENFIFHVEWRFTPREGETRYNSGIFVRNSADGSIWHQAQAGLSGGFLFADTLIGGVKQRVNFRPQMKENRVRLAGEWNTYEITCSGRRISLAVNGAVTSEFTACEVPRGYVGLEAEGHRIEFRNIRLKNLR